MPPQNKSSTATLCYFILFGICAIFFLIFESLDDYMDCILHFEWH